MPRDAAARSANGDHLYAALEVGGAMRSLDGGEHWDDCSASLLAGRAATSQEPEAATPDVEGMMDRPRAL